MPSVVNGIGTWYCGKRRIHRVKAVCSQCKSLTELESYDTTLFIVVAFIPIIPLGQKRILESCPACRRHRHVPLKKWEESKSAAFNGVLEDLRANPDDKNTIQKALALATMYQDEQVFDRLADVLPRHRTGDADIQSQMGGAYEYFSRWAKAETAYRQALAVAPNDHVRERLAICLLKQGRPEEAIPFASHIFAQKDPNKAWLSFWLIDGCMAQGLHDLALELIDMRDAAFPQIAEDKVYRKQRRTAEKYRGTSKRIASVCLGESAGAGYREGSSLGFKWPKYVAAAVILGLLALYLGSAAFRGRHRPVWLVNGWNKPYTVAVNGKEYQLQPGSGQKIDVPEGAVTVDWPAGGEGPQTATIQTSFFGRPFNRPLFVINPDRCALLEGTDTVYSSAAITIERPPSVYSTAKLLHSFPEVNYEFQPFPLTIQLKAGEQVVKSRVGLVPVADTSDRIYHVMLRAPAAEQQAYAKRLVQLDPDDSLALAWLTSLLPEPEALALLKPRLADRPVRVEWHRQYQSLMELANPAVDLTPEYTRLVAETKHSPDAVYLLGRIGTGAAAEKQYLEAANGQPPSAFGCAGLGFRCLARGDFKAAVKWLKKAVELNPGYVMHRQLYLGALLAAGRFQEFLAESDKDPLDRPVIALSNRLAAHLALGDRATADKEVARIIQNVTLTGERYSPKALTALRADLDTQMALAERDPAKYLSLARATTGKSEFALNFLAGKYKEAADVQFGSTGPFDWETEAVRAGLLYLAGRKTNDAAFAGQRWKELVNTLAQGDREARQLADIADGKKPLDLPWLRGAVIRPQLKRVLLAALACRLPDAKELDTLAQKLDFEYDVVSLCLRYVREPGDD